MTAGVAELGLYLLAINGQINLPQVIYLILPLAVFPIAAYQLHLEEQEEIRETEKNYKNLLSARPVISLSFNAEGNQGELVVPLKTCPPEPNHDLLIQQKKSQLFNEYDAVKHPNNYGFLPVLDLPFRGINEDYLSEVEDYLLEYKEYLKQAHFYSVSQTHLKYLKFFAINVGLESATDVQIKLTFPKPLRFASPEQEEWLLDEEEPYKSMHKPRPPKEPDKYIDRLSAIVTHMPYLTDDLQSNGYEQDGPYRYEENSQDTQVTYVFEKIIPDLPVELEALPFWFDGMAENGIIEVPVRIFASQLPKAIDRSLRLNITVP